MNSSEFSTFLQTRRSVREYTDEDVDTDTIHRLLNITQFGPTAGNRQAWDVIVVTDPGIKEDLFDIAYQQEHLLTAPVLFVICANYVRSMSQYGERGILYALQDATIAGTYLMLAAHAEGLQTCWTGAFEDDGIREVLDVPEHIRPLAILALGHGKMPATRPDKIPLSEHLHENIW